MLLDGMLEGSAEPFEFSRPCGRGKERIGRGRAVRGGGERKQQTTTDAACACVFFFRLSILYCYGRSLFNVES